LIGLQLVGTNGIGNRFARVVASNGWLPTGDGPVTDGFLRWRKFALKQTKMDVGWIIKRSVIRKMKPEEIAAYDAPFPNEKYQAGALIFPQLVPITPDNPSSQYNRDAWKNLQLFHRPFLTLFSDSDPVTVGAEKFLQMSIPGANGQPHTIITQAAHFLQEDKPHEIVKHLIKFINDNPLPLDSKPWIKSQGTNT
jgi:haloalkane dehalogenase